MTIRKATRFDQPQIFDMLRHFRDEGKLNDINGITDINGEETPNKILAYILAGGGVAFVSEVNGKLNGMLLGIKTPQLWDQTKYLMQEIVFWVELEHRGTTAGYRLLSAYVDACEAQKDSGHITIYTMSQLPGTSLKFDRFGFKKSQETWSA